MMWMLSATSSQSPSHRGTFSDPCPRNPFRTSLIQLTFPPPQNQSLFFRCHPPDTRLQNPRNRNIHNDFSLFHHPPTPDPFQPNRARPMKTHQLMSKSGSSTTSAVP